MRTTEINWLVHVSLLSAAQERIATLEGLLTKEFGAGWEDWDPASLRVANRRAEAAEAKLAQASPAERAWLIEHSGALPGYETGIISWLCVGFKFRGHGARDFTITHDASKALRFVRKEDAEAVLTMYLGASPPDWYSKPFSVTEHEWPGPAAAPAEPVRAALARDDLVLVLRRWAEHQMVFARGFSNLGRPETDNDCGRQAVVMRNAAEEIERLRAALAALPNEADSLSADHHSKPR